MPSHYSCAEKHILECADPNGFTTAAGVRDSVGNQLDAKKLLWSQTVGDAATRQGDFYEAICFAKEKEIADLVLSSRTTVTASAVRPAKSIRRALDVVQPNDWQELDGANVGRNVWAGRESIAHIRAGKGPVFFWVMMERLSSHTSSDDSEALSQRGRTEKM